MNIVALHGTGLLQQDQYIDYSAYKLDCTDAMGYFRWILARELNGPSSVLI